MTASYGPRDATAELVNYGLNLNSAGDFIYIIRQAIHPAHEHRQHRRFHHLDRRDNGEPGHARAVAALRQHLEYYTGLKGDKLAFTRAVLAKHQALLPSPSDFFDSPEEVSPSTTYIEGRVRQVLVNSYEPNSNARTKCLAHHGTCSVCTFDFGMAYGEIAERFIPPGNLQHRQGIRNRSDRSPSPRRPLSPTFHFPLSTGPETAKAA